MSKERPLARSRFEETHPVLQTRVPKEFHERIKAEARSRRISLAKLLTHLFDDYTASVPDLDALKDQWKEEGWIECASWLLAKFRAEGFCNMDLNRLTQWLQSESETWPKVQAAARGYRDEEEGEPSEVVESEESR